MAMWTVNVIMGMRMKPKYLGHEFFQLGLGN